jgi:hypothetical protein
VADRAVDDHRLRGALLRLLGVRVPADVEVVEGLLRQRDLAVNGALQGQGGKEESGTPSHPQCMEAVKAPTWEQRSIISSLMAVSGTSSEGSNWEGGGNQFPCTIRGH